MGDIAGLGVDGDGGAASASHSGSSLPFWPESRLVCLCSAAALCHAFESSESQNTAGVEGRRRSIGKGWGYIRAKKC